MQTEFSKVFRRFWSHEKTSGTVKVALALASAILLSLLQLQLKSLIGLILGVIAAALAETEERPRAQLRQALLTLACFALTSVSVRALIAQPGWLLLGLFVSSFCFVMLGAVSESYAKLASATQILGIYTLISAGRPGAPPGLHLEEPLLLLGGAGLYSACALAWVSLFPARPARQALASVYAELAAVLERKAELLEPVGTGEKDRLRLEVADLNSELVRRMNSTRQLLLSWTRSSRVPRHSRRLLRLYFLAQDLHERITSSHESYSQLARVFARSDLLFRVAHLLRVQAQACAQLARAVSLNESFEYEEQGQLILEEVHASLARVENGLDPEWDEYLDSVTDLARNLTALDRLLASASHPESLQDERDSSLRDHEPQSLAEAVSRVRSQFSPRSPRFRHALRLAVALSLGDLLLLSLPLLQGYWVLLTTIFVLQPTYSGTWNRFRERVSGTLLGLLLAWSVIHLVPAPEAQLGLALLAGVGFFYLRLDSYFWATTAMTVLVFLLLNQLGVSQLLFWPRLVDTILGALLAGLVVAVVLPDWQGRHLHRKMATCLHWSAAYLEQVLEQYESGREDHLRYRIARREAHVAEAELAQTVRAMLGEPDRHRLSPQASFAFRRASHTLLSYISALGAHREAILAPRSEELVARAGQAVLRNLRILSAAYEQPRAVEPQELLQLPLEELLNLPAKTPKPERRLLRQLALIAELIPELTRLSRTFEPPRPAAAESVVV